jgi:hypothetical protein
MATLDVNVEAIIDAIVGAIEAETESGGTLPDVRSVVRGDRARPMPNLPSVWVVPQLAQMIRGHYGDEDWTLPISIAALVKGDTPAEAGRDSQRIAALARSAALRARDVANADGAAVTDIVSTSFDPTARSSERNRTLFWTEATISVTFTVTE